MYSDMHPGSWKSGRSKGGSVNFVVYSSKCGQGGGGGKIMKILQMSYMDACHIWMLFVCEQCKSRNINLCDQEVQNTTQIKDTIPQGS